MKSPVSKRDPDPALIERARTGDRESLKALLEEVGPPVRQWALAHTGDPESAADLAQEVFLLLIRKISTYRGEARFLTWLFSITRNQALEAHRKKGRYEKKMGRLKAKVGQGRSSRNLGGDQVDRDRLGRLVAAFVQDLPKRQREVFQLSEFQGLSSPEVGAVLQMSPGSVRAALLKARRSLRRTILENHPEFVEEYLP